MSRDEFGFDDVVRTHKLARSDGLESTQLHLGYEETHDLMKDDNFMRSSQMAQSNGGGSIGVVAGIDVEQAHVSHMRVMTAQDNGRLAYYIL